MYTESIIYIHFSTFLRYHIHLLCREYTDINLADYGHKEINITEI